jgi:PhnB protein
MPKPVPDGFHTVTPSLVVRGAAAAIEFYQKAFGAVLRTSMPGPGGLLMHAEIQIGDSILMLVDEMPGPGGKAPPTYGGTSVGLMLYLPDVDAAWKRAVDAGAKVLQPLADQFWGDRYGRLADPFGHDWALATHIEDVPPEEMAGRMAKMMPS